MARHGIAQITEKTPGDTAASTWVQLVAGATHGFKLTEFGVSFHGIVNTNEPCLVELVRQSTAGTSSALTPVKADDSVGDALETTARHTATVEPTTTDVVRVFAVHPQTTFVYPVQPMAPILVGAADRLGLRIKTPVAVEFDAYMCFEE